MDSPIVANLYFLLPSFTYFSKKNLNERMIISSDKYKMQKIFVSMVTIVTLLSTASAEETTATSFPQIESGTNGDEYDSDSARKIIGSR